VRRVPAFGDQPETVLARVFLDADGGPMVVQVDEGAVTQLAALGVADGDRIVVTRSSETG
jgi:hypothetical protein